MKSTALFLFLCFLCIPLSLVAKQKNETSSEPKSKLAYSGFSGGMLLHTGYVWSRSLSIMSTDGSVVNNQQPKGLAYGIGGVIRFHFGEHLRIGTEGYSTNLVYGKHKSFSKIGWGGLLADYVFQVGKFYPYFGLTIGGGAVKNLILLENVSDDYQVENRTVSYRRYGFMALTPYIGTEIALTQKLHLNLKLDYMTNLTNWADDFVTGPRIYVGIVFCRM